MLDRLKSLPLTIFLTILIWMYAEAQFTSTQPEVPISVRVASGSPDFAVRTMDPVDKRYTNMLSFVVTLQGPKNQIDQIFEEAQGMRDNTEEDKLAALTYIPTAEQLRTVGAGGELHPNVLPLLNGLEYFRSRGVTVTYASPVRVTIDVDSVARVHKVALFQSAVAVESAVLDPPEVDVQIPTDTLRAISTGGENKLVIHAVPMNELQMAAIPADTEKVIPVRYVADYPGARDERIRVIPAQGTAKVRILWALPGSLTVSDVPIWVSGPPEMLARYDVEVLPKTVNLTFSGPKALVEGLRQKLAGGAPGAGVYAYLDLAPEDKADPTAMMRRSLRYVYPDGLTLLKSQPDAGFRLTEKVAVTVPTTQAGGK